MNKGLKLVISFKSASIELSVVNIDKKPQLLFSKKESLLYKEPLSPTDFANKTLEALKKLLKENSLDITKTLKYSKDCEIIFHSPWFLPEIISEENKGQNVSLKQFFLDKVKPPQQKDYMQIENKITNISLNGYKLSKLKDVVSDDIEIDLYRSFVSGESVKQIQEIIQSSFRNIKDFSYSTSAMEIFETMKDIFVDEDNFIFLNIGGEVTEIGISENDAFVYSASVPMGSHFFARELDTFLTEKENLGTLKFLADKSTDENLDQTRKQKIIKAKNKWGDEVFKVLNEKGKVLPRKIFFVANSDTVNFFKMVLNVCERAEEFDTFLVNEELFSEKVENLENNSHKNVEYLLSTYYLSIKK